MHTCSIRLNASLVRLEIASTCNKSEPRCPRMYYLAFTLNSLGFVSFGFLVMMNLEERIR